MMKDLSFTQQTEQSHDRMYTTNPEPHNNQRTELTSCVQAHAANRGIPISSNPS